VGTCLLQEDFHEVTKDYPDAWHSMNLVAEHRLRMLHSSPVYKGWSLNQKQQTAPSSLLSIKIEQVLEVRHSCNALYRDAQYTSPSGFSLMNATRRTLFHLPPFFLQCSFKVLLDMRRIYVGRQPQVLVTCQDIEAQLSSTDTGHVYSSRYLWQCVSLQCVCTLLICDCMSDAALCSRCQPLACLLPGLIRLATTAGCLGQTQHPAAGGRPKLALACPSSSRPPAHAGASGEVLALR